MSTSLMETRSNLPAPNVPRFNVVAAVSFLTPLLLGGLLTWLTLNPAGAIVGLLLGLLFAQAPKVRVTLIANSPPQVVGLLVQPGSLAQNRGEHLLNDILGGRGIGKQQYGISIQRRAVGVV